MSGSKIERRKWQCPVCERRYNIPVTAKTPSLCPQCTAAHATEKVHYETDDMTPERQIQEIPVIRVEERSFGAEERLKSRGSSVAWASAVAGCMSVLIPLPLLFAILFGATAVLLGIVAVFRLTSKNVDRTLVAIGIFCGLWSVGFGTLITWQRIQIDQITSQLLSTHPLSQLRLTSNDDGSLKQITFNQQNLGNDDDSLQQLEIAVGKIAKSKEIAETREQQIDIVADEHLGFEFVHDAVSVCADRLDEATLRWTNRSKSLRLIVSASEAESAIANGTLIVPTGLPRIRVRLAANSDGSLKMLSLGRRDLGDGTLAFEQLNAEIRKIIGRPGNPLTKNVVVSIHGDKNLRYQHAIDAIKACSGRFDVESNRWVVYIYEIELVIGSTNTPPFPPVP